MQPMYGWFKNKLLQVCVIKLQHNAVELISDKAN